MPVLEQIPLWFKLEPQYRGRPVLEAVRNAPAECWRGNALSIHAGVFQPDGEPFDLSNVALFGVRILSELADDADVLVEKTLNGAGVTDTITAAGFAARTAAHAVFTLSTAETSLDIGTEPMKSFALVFYAVTAGGNELTYGAGELRVFADAAGTGASGPPPVPPSEYYTKVEMNALLTNKQPLNSALTDYAGAANSAARRGLIEAAAKDLADPETQAKLLERELLSIGPITAGGVAAQGLTFAADKYREWFGFLDEDHLVADLKATTTVAFNSGLGEDLWPHQFQCQVSSGSAGIAVTPSANSWVGIYCPGSFIMPFIGVEAQPIATLTGGADEYIDLGFSVYGTNFAYLRYSVSNNTVQILYDGPGSPYTGPTVSVPSGLPYKMGLGISDKSIHIWWKQTIESPWKVIAVASILVNTVDFRAPAVLASLGAAVGGGKSAGTGAHVFANIRMGYLHGVGIANQSFIRDEVGRPLVKDGRYFFLANKTHPSESSALQYTVSVSNVCVFSIDPLTMDTRCVAQMSCLRGSFVYGENSGCAYYDTSLGRWIFLIPSWGSFDTAVPVDIYKYTLNSFPRGPQVLTDGALLAMPNPSAHSFYDPSVWKVGSTYYMAASRTDNRTLGGGWVYGPMLYSGSSIDSLAIAADVHATGPVEGMKLININGSLVALGGVTSGTFKVFSVPAMTVLGTVANPWGSQSPPSHPNLIQLHTPQGKARYFWLGFKQVQFGVAQVYSHGPQVSAIATTSPTGSEVALRQLKE